MTETKKTKIKIAIFVISLITQSMNSIALVLSGVADAFPKASVTSVQLVYTLITLVSVAGTLLAGKLTGITTKKIIIIIFSAVLCAGGLLGYFAGYNLFMLYTASIFIGLGNGVLIPAVTALVAEHFEGGERASVVGVQTLFVNGGAILINLLAGFLAAQFWRNTYLIFLLTLPVITVALFLLPKGRIERPVQGEKVRIFNTYLITLVIQAFIFGICWMTLNANATYYVFELGVGNESQAGLITMTFAAGGVVIGLVLRRALEITGKYCFAVAHVSAAISLWVFYFAGSLWMLIVAGALMGIGFGFLMPSGYTLIPNKVHPAAITMAIAIFTAALSLGAFLNPYIITTSAGMINGSVSTRFLMAAVLQSLNLIFSIVVARKVSSSEYNSGGNINED